MEQWIGILAGVFTTISYFPQAYKVHKTKDTESISLKMFSILLLGLAGWIWYGFMLDKLPIVIFNLISFLMTFYIVVMKLRYG